jgi:hypothetical protein
MREGVCVGRAARVCSYGRYGGWLPLMNDSRLRFNGREVVYSEGYKPGLWEEPRVAEDALWRNYSVIAGVRGFTFSFSE